MKAQFVYENAHFQRGIDPKEGMGIGLEKRRLNKKSLKELSRISKIDISEDMDHILNLLDRWGAVITDVDPDFCQGARGGDCAWVAWDLENGRDNGENFSYVKNPKPIPWLNQGDRKWYQRKKKYEKDVWEHNDPNESGHNGEFFSNILGEIRYEAVGGWPGNTDDYDFRRANDELEFLNGK